MRALTDTWAHLRALAKSHVDPGEILTHLIRLLTTDRHDSFMSMFFVRIDPSLQNLVYASAEHPGFLISSSAGCSSSNEATISYREHEFQTDSRLEQPEKCKHQLLTSFSLLAAEKVSHENKTRTP